MPLIRREHTDTAVSTTATGTILIGDTSITMAASTGWPTGGTGAFTATINKDKPDEERILVATRSGTTLNTITRGYAGTPAAQHTGNPTLDHTFSGLEADEDNQAVMNTIGLVTAAGDLLQGSGLNTMQRLAAGANGTVLSMVSGLAAWAANGVLPASATIATQESNGGVSYVDLATPGPVVNFTVTSLGKVKVTLTAEVAAQAAADGGYMGFALSGANTATPSIARSLIIQSPTGGGFGGEGSQGSAVFFLSGLLPGATTITAKYRSDGIGVFFVNRTIIVEAY